MIKKFVLTTFFSLLGGIAAWYPMVMIFNSGYFSTEHVNNDVDPRLFDLSLYLETTHSLTYENFIIGLLVFLIISIFIVLLPGLITQKHKSYKYYFYSTLRTLTIILFFVYLGLLVISYTEPYPDSPGLTLMNNQGFGIYMSAAGLVVITLLIYFSFRGIKKNTDPTKQRV